MARRKRRYLPRIRRTRRRGTRDRRLPLLPAIGLGLGVLAPGAWGKSPVQHIMDGEYTEGMRALSISFSGLDPMGLQYGWQYQKATGLWGLIAGLIGSKIATAAGANRVIKRLPMVGRYIKL